MSFDPARFARLDEYELAAPLGSGATARVFEGKHLKSGRLVAIKMLDASARGQRELRERLAREAVLLTGVQSPYVSRLLGFGWEDDQPFLVLERLTGETLGDVLKREGRLSVSRLVEWIEELLIGVRDCHNANVIHRDIKPSNIFLETRQSNGQPQPPVVKLIDFGVARLNEIAKAGTSLTSTHHLIGSMGYMAPEQLEYAKGVGPAADLYAIGVVIFRCVSGRLPFVGRSFEALQKLKTEAVAPKLSSMPGVIANSLLDEFVARALVRKPADRYSSASEMLQEWWRVAAALDRDQPLVEEGTDVVFEDDEPSQTLVEGGDGHESGATTLPNAHPPSGHFNPATTLTEGECPTGSGAKPFAAMLEIERELVRTGERAEAERRTEERSERTDPRPEDKPDQKAEPKADVDTNEATDEKLHAAAPVAESRAEEPLAERSGERAAEGDGANEHVAEASHANETKRASQPSASSEAADKGDSQPAETKRDGTDR